MGRKAKTPTVLIVNDDESLLQLIRTVIEDQGLRTIGCRDAEEALSRLREKTPVDLIITDVHMPTIDGWQFCRLLRSREYVAYNRIPILVVSSTFSGTDAEDVTTELGANAFLAAPFEAATLQRYVSDMLLGRTPQARLGVLVVEDEKSEARRGRRAAKHVRERFHFPSSFP